MQNRIDGPLRGEGCPAALLSATGGTYPLESPAPVSSSSPFSVNHVAALPRAPGGIAVRSLLASGLA